VSLDVSVIAALLVSHSNECSSSLPEVLLQSGHRFNDSFDCAVCQMKY